MKKGIQSLVGKDSVDYFMEEFGDRLGITDETGTIELSNPELNRYLPFMGEIKNIEGRRIVRRDPNLLLLSLEPEDRKYISLFWNEVYKNKQAPFDVDFQPTNKMGWVEVKEYALDSEDIARIVSRPQIVGFSELVNIGKKHRISGLASYADKLEQFREDLAMIPRD